MSRSRPISADSVPAPSASSWLAHHLWVGAILGFGLATLDQLAIWALGAAEVAALEPITAGQRLLAVALITVSYSVWVGLCGLLGSAVVRWRRARQASRAMTTVLLAVALLGHGIGLAVRVLSGSFMTVGGVQFCVSSWQHFVHVVLVGYRGYTVAMAIAVAVASVLVFRWLRPGRPRRLGATLIAVLSLGTVGAAAIGVGGKPTLRGAWRAAPELALVGSIEPVWTMPEVEDPAEGPPAATPGLPLSSGKLWAAAASVKRPRPNFLLIMLESIAVERLGYMGAKRRTTPNIDRLASNSVRFRRAYTTATHSNYAQMAVLSSLFPRRGTALDMYHKLDYPRVLPHDVFHLAGHRTATISSQDESWQGMIRFQHTGTTTEFWHAPSYEGTHIDTGSERVVPDHVTAARASDWIASRAAAGDGWSLYVNLQMTHFPYKIPAGQPRPFQPSDPTGRFNYLGYGQKDLSRVVNRYDNALAYVDRQVGLLLKGLRDSNQLDDTLIVLTADHGEAFFEHGGVTHGKTLYDEEARVPLLMHWPKRLAANDVDVPVSHLDIMPTVVELAGLPPHPAYQGTSLKPVIDGDDDRPGGIYLNIQGIRNAEALGCWPWKMIMERTSGAMYLFNLAQDPREKQNRLVAEAKVAGALRATLDAQLSAQQEYHGGDAKQRKTHFVPRLLRCPERTAMPRASR